MFDSHGLFFLVFFLFLVQLVFVFCDKKKYALRINLNSHVAFVVILEYANTLDH